MIKHWATLILAVCSGNIFHCVLGNICMAGIEFRSSVCKRCSLALVIFFFLQLYIFYHTENQLYTIILCFHIFINYTQNYKYLGHPKSKAQIDLKMSLTIIILLNTMDFS